ncbi:MAG: amino acid ABC transporter substrate-binding protein [Burkholderiales bacterium RIFCSPLOWO2_12_FULL_61_40]|nr:MAG: amino acid ABC transporter substrate-binding protein [Burkholderiales bacterium RIFCSPLOWO2_12_FULL_61_40]
MRNHLTRRLASSTLACVLGLGVLLPTTGQAGAVLDRIKASGEITLAHRESSVPFSFMNRDKKPVGYALDLCHKLVEAVARQLALPTLATRYLQVTPANRIAMIEEGKADLECGSTTNNAERREKVAFTVPHYITGARFLVRADTKAQRLNDFRGFKMVSTKGTTPLAAITRANSDQLLGMQILEAPDHARAVDMVESGEADAFAMDDVLLYGLAAGRAVPGKLKVVGKFLTIEPLAIMLPKNDPEFKKLIDNEMRRLILSKEAQSIYERWFIRAIPPNDRALNLPMNYLLKDFWKYPSDQVPG